MSAKCPASPTLEVVEDLIHLPWFYNLQQPAPRGRDRQAHRQSSLCYVKAVQNSVGERQTDHKHQDLSVQRPCVEHFTLWQRNLDNSCPSRTSPQQLPSALPMTNLGPYILTGRSIQQGCHRAGEHSKRARVAVPETPRLARPCPADGGWTPSKGCPLRRTCVRFQAGWLSNATPKDVCKRDMKSAEIHPDLWEAAAADRSKWRRVVRTGAKRAKAKREQLWHDGRERQKARASSVPSLSTPYICSNCDRDCHSRIGLYNYNRRCPKTVS